MFRRNALRLVNAVRGRPVTSMVVMGLLGATVAATAIAASEQGGGPITAVKVVRDTAANTTGSTSYVDLPGAQTTITVPSGQRALLLARFTAKSDCIPAAGGCEGQVRILIGGVEGAPACGGECAFDSTSAGEAPELEAHAIERSRGGLSGLPAGSYTVQVQYRALLNGTFSLDDWHLTVERSQIG